MGWDVKLESLYGYWVNCCDIWQLVEYQYKPNDEIPEAIQEYSNQYQSFYRLAIAYGLLYVVIEGYKDLKLHDQKIDSLIDNVDYLDNLKRLRNSMFHYQKHPEPKKLMDFINMPESHDWVRKVKKSFENYFINHLPLEQMIAIIKGSMPDKS